MLENIRSSRITKTEILFDYEHAKKLGLDHDIRKDVYEQVPHMKLDAIKRIHSEHISNKRYSIVVLGNQKLIGQKGLSLLPQG